MAPDVSLICDAGLFMFQSRSQWQFTWWTHKNAKYSPVTHFWESEAELTCHVSPVSIFTVWGWELRQKPSISWHQAVRAVQSAGGRQLSEPGETQSVSDRSARCITASHVSRAATWPITCHEVLSPDVWLKCDSNSLKLSSISLSGCDKRNSPIKLFLTSAESQHQTFIWKHRQCVSVTLITSCGRDGRVSGVIFISDGSLWLLYNINTHYIGAQEREKTPVRFIIHCKIGICGGDNDW